jgi:hypothetical protein
MEAEKNRAAGWEIERTTGRARISASDPQYQQLEIPPPGQHLAGEEYPAPSTLCF